jgi:hypothetical protein
MEQEVEPQDEDGVDGRRLMGGMGGRVIWVLWTTHQGLLSSFFFGID